MIKPYGPSQPPTPGCGIQTLPAFCHKERFLSYKKKGRKKRGGGMVQASFTNKCSALPAGSHPISLCQAGGSHVGGKIGGFPTATCSSPW